MLRDDFGADPQVRRLRSVFKALESWEQEAAARLGLEWTDPRLGLIRGRALVHFEREAAGLVLGSDREAVQVYARAYRSGLKELGLGELAARLPAEEPEG